METNGLKVVKELPNNMEGQIVVFEEPLEIQTWKVIKKSGQLIPNKDGTRTTTTTEKLDKVIKCFFMRAESGFGCHKECSGRMIIGKFFDTIENVKKNKPIDSGNTKVYPSGFIPELFNLN